MKIKSLDEFILFENKDYIIINKPYGIASLQERDTTRVSIQQLAKEYIETTQLCHRLDKETSGALALAKNPEAYKNLSEQFAKRKVSKTYHAFVDGLAEFNEYECDLPIAISGKGKVRIDKQEGKKSSTVFNTLETFSKHSLVECKPKTGRMHQIRIHLAASKHSIISDEQYGGNILYLSQIKPKFRNGKYEEEQPLIKRVALHAFKLGFTGLEGEEIVAEAPYPKDLKALKNQLKKVTKR
ncbi:RluA family pseudouridine synthase [Chondrinema litorale]|uniref:RluA family pseudouridine synthase n=1 Tax=Chondrinema litorale TaxID=2994555 RepID=UPI002543DBD9|nr:pseudouridine synthase [Chondrinema litorale]UZR94881.1 pseudouridine synthase [Chondrinema litorale]